MSNNLEVKNISKFYPSVGIHALNNISTSFKSGEITAIAGENGAGKSTLVKILFGITKPDKGSIILDNKTININNSQDAINHKLGMVFQHFKLVEELTVAQNIALGNEDKKNFFFTNQKQINKRVQHLIDKYDFNINSNSLVKELTTGEKQIVEILKMLYKKSEILIFDEPTAVLSETEAKRLFKTIKQLKSDNKCIIIITHKIKEILKISDKVIVLRQGNLIGEYLTTSLNQNLLTKYIIGHETKKEDLIIHQKTKGEKVLEFKNIVLKKHFQNKPLLNDISFSLHKGEILGFCAVSGNGKGVLEAVLGGMMKISSGKIYYHGSDISHYSAPDLRKMGLAFVPSDRNHYGSASKASLSENMIINKRDKLKEKSKITKNFISKYNITALAHQKMGTLSGGNKQKAIIAREIDNMNDYIVFSNPTWGLDFNSTSFIHSKIIELKKQNKAIILLSSDLDEIIKLSDTINVIFEGSIRKTFLNDTSINKKQIGHYMLGKDKK
ncbi:MAG: ABC transporter ATP-binding protein [Pleomorphochaeta sp.]